MFPNPELRKAPLGSPLRRARALLAPEDAPAWPALARIGIALRWFVTFLAAANIALVVYLWLTHLRFPLQLDLMEGVVLQHFRRAMAFQPIYPEPSPAYVPLAYNPLYYVLAVPFGWMLGASLPTLRLVSILGALLSGAIIFAVVRQHTRSAWWGLAALGLFAAAYRVMDAYLDTAHADAWFLAAALLGSYLIDRNRSRGWNLAGVILLVASFWFKQHGVFFALGGLLFLTWREGLKRSLSYWAVAVLLGPVAYLLAGPRVFGPQFLYFTWEVPRAWMQLDLSTVRHYVAFVLRSYPILALVGVLVLARSVLFARTSLDVWRVQFVFAALSGLMGALDPGSSNNVFIAMGTWFILVGTLGLQQWMSSGKRLASRLGLPSLALAASFACLAYNPLAVMTSSQADASYRDLLAFLNSLDGPVYAPSIGQLPAGYTLQPAAHWVALEDMIRGPGRDTRNQPITRQLLEPAIHPAGPAFILANHPLDVYPWIAFLEDYYTLDQDLGDRFKPLSTLPRRWDHGWPQYLYRYTGSATGLALGDRDAARLTTTP